MKKKLLFISLLLVFLSSFAPVQAQTTVSQQIVSPGPCYSKTDMQLSWLGTLFVNFHSRTQLPGFSHIPGGITPATIPLRGGKGDLLLSGAWEDYVERINGRNAKIIKYLFHKDSGWQNSVEFGRVKELTFEAQLLNVLRLSGDKAYIQTYFLNELQPLVVSPSDLRIQNFTIVTRDDKIIGPPPGPAKIILIARAGESLWIPTSYLTCPSRLPKSAIVTAWPSLNIRSYPEIGAAKTAYYPYLTPLVIRETSVDAQRNIWGKTDVGWVALRYNGQLMTDWQVTATQ